jgi:hypothetical protein
MTPRDRAARLRELGVIEREGLAATRRRHDGLMRRLLAEERDWAREASSPAGRATDAAAVNPRGRPSPGQ